MFLVQACPLPLTLKQMTCQRAWQRGPDSPSRPEKLDHCVIHHDHFSCCVSVRIARRMRKKVVQQGRSERRGESYSVLYVEPLSDARTTLGDFFRTLLEFGGVSQERLAGKVCSNHGWGITEPAS